MVDMLHSVSQRIEAFANDVQVASAEAQDDFVVFSVWPYLHLVFPCPT